MSNIVIVGSGPAGGSAALYAVRAGVQTTVLTKGFGALARAEKIENYYGFVEPISGRQLVAQGIEQAKRLGITVGTAISVAAVATGWILSAAGEALCFIANDAARPHIHSHRYGG